MVLRIKPLPEFYNCATKRFLPDELHITRICRQSVLILMWKGVLRFREDGVDREIHAGEYYIQRAGLLHEGLLPCDSPEYLYVHFYGQFSEDGAGLALRGNIPEKTLRPMCDRLENMWLDRSYDAFRLNSQMLRIFSELSAGSLMNEEQSSIAYRIKTHLDVKYTEPIRLSDLSASFGYTEDHLIRSFRAQYGITPHKYLIGKRMDHARWLLENTSLSAEQISSAVGYSDFSTFYRAFCKAHGSAPGALRKKGD